MKFTGFCVPKVTGRPDLVEEGNIHRSPTGALRSVTRSESLLTKESLLPELRELSVVSFDSESLPPLPGPLCRSATFILPPGSGTRAGWADPNDRSDDRVRQTRDTFVGRTPCPLHRRRVCEWRD